MKITSVDVIKSNGGASSVKGAHWNPVFCRINTDEGISGFGEAGVAYTCGTEAAFGMIKDFAELIIGMDPMNIEAIWYKLQRTTFWGMGGGTIIFSGMSAIDIALWDIKGKKLGVPVYQLLGGKTNTKLRAYASQIQFDWGKECRPLSKPEDYAEAAKKAMAEGYTCVKVDPVGFDEEGVWMSWSNYGLLENKQLKVAVDRIAAIREACGPDLDIIIELHSLTDTNTAIQLGRELEKYRCFYYEEPTQPLNSDLFKEISNNVKIPMASGERIYTRWGYRPFFEDRSLAIIQPDLCNTGGITEGKKICDMAHTYDIGVQLHICGGPITIAAALQLEAVIPNFVIHEHHQSALMDENIKLCKYDYQPVNGYYEVPELPGIGNELTDEAIANAEVYTVK
ncbi:mandelate racemase/muconate lactonizing enzyme family protein [Youngiibacter multivorans]|uniref:L-alanine-DL-glutamate epimerase-like enolase superfamily enzyme n=1 Tax=Youngiibacter multivorans TaxID=937251 RepID=A0ABS4FZG9_9CLOT|nr:mandelate racemase/muconate lactonizing enzyme family protein [Youngiibacter multivorans]MBP1917692.1 L-alanine-DL-glutamate epimerase-like enolase superfamily enzyme [Youngiibacter multivorans]